MNKNESEMFSKEQIEYVDKLFYSKDNQKLLNKVKEYKIETKKLEELYNVINSKTSKDIKDLFYDYDGLVWECRSYELTLIYHLGIKKGIEMQDLNTN